MLACSVSPDDAGVIALKAEFVDLPDLQRVIARVASTAGPIDVLQGDFEPGGFLLHYQPVVGLETGGAVGAEAFLRWRLPRGLAPPTDLVPLAEAAGYAVPLGEWLPLEACRQIRALKERLSSDPAMWVSFSASARQVRPRLLDTLRAALNETEVPPDSLMLGITESTQFDDFESAIDLCMQLKELGIRLALDNFGEGYASISWARRLPIDVIKIPRSFIDEVGGSGEESDVVAAVIGLAGVLGMESHAVGVESADQAARLRRMGCTTAQGDFFGAPMPSEQLVDLVAKQPWSS